MNDSAPAFVEQQSAVLFADVCDSTRLYETVGDESALAAINDCLGLLGKLTRENHGRVVKTLGDGLMAVFPDASRAILSACEMQASVTKLPPIGKSRLALRIGCNYGLVLEQPNDKDIFGDTVNVAARLANFARPGQIIATKATVADLSPVFRTGTRNLDVIQVKGKSDPIHVVEILWSDTDDATLVANRTYGADRDLVKLHLTYRQSAFTMGQDCTRLTIGRDPSSTIVVETPTASRQHSRIEFRSDRFVYIDQSTNGSYITINGDKELRLIREEFILRGSGWIGLGKSYAAAPAMAIAFIC